MQMLSINSIPKSVTLLTSPPKVPAKRDPKIGPVQENDTIAKVSAIKKIPISPPIFEPESALFPHLLGSVSSKYPKKEMAKII